MTMDAQTWFDRVRQRCADLAAHPGILFVLLFTANALARPYGGLMHDARLYSVQVLNQVEPGSYEDDLFLKFGSQDQFSFYSRVLAPFVTVFGLETTFFVTYLLFNGLLIFALQRLVLALVTDRAMAVVGLLYMMVTPLFFGGLSVFQVLEPFLTPRILANALTLLALERLLARRYFLSLLLILAAAAMHPLMAQAGLLIWLGVVGWNVLPRRGLIICLVTVFAAALTLLYRPWGLRLFGEMDEPWREIVLVASAYNFPEEWHFRDWVNIAFSLSVVMAGAYALRHEDYRRARFLTVAAVAGTAGLIGTIVGAAFGYAFLFQAQPYRILWVLEALTPPLAFWLAARLWRSAAEGEASPHAAWTTAGKRLAAVLFLAQSWISGEMLLEWFVPLFFLPVLMIGFRGLEERPRRPDWLAAAGLYSLILGGLAWAVYKLSVLLGGADEIAALVDGLEFARICLAQVGAIFWFLVMIALGGWMLRKASAAALVGALGVALLAQATFFLVPALPSYRDHGTRYQGDLRRVANYLQEIRQPGDSRPTVYSSLGRIDYVWVDLRAQSYFDWAQIVGCLFNRGNAEEGQRRALVVRPFEVDRIQESLKFLQESRRHSLERLFQTDFETLGLSPTRADLERLCTEESIDYLILKQEFPGLVTQSFGRIHLYDCRQVRLALTRTAPTPVAAARDATLPVPLPVREGHMASH